MTPDQKKLVQATWSKVVPIADQAAAMFYDRLFQIDPSARALFGKSDMVVQRKKLLQVLSVAVAGLDDLEALVPTVEALGRRHVRYGVNDAHYASVGIALLWTLEKGLGPAWTPATAAAWTEVYGVLSGVMRKAAQGPTPAAA
jgi:hemoglobin-like flavoprotein